MPTYEYECQACGERHDIFQRMSDDPLVDCPGCGKPELKKLLSAAAFQLKGSGWYQTDFRNNDKNSGKQDSGSAGSPSASACGTGDCGCH